MIRTQCFLSDAQCFAMQWFGHVELISVREKVRQICQCGSNLRMVISQLVLLYGKHFAQKRFGISKSALLEIKQGQAVHCFADLEMIGTPMALAYFDGLPI